MSDIACFVVRIESLKASFFDAERRELARIFGECRNEFVSWTDIYPILSDEMLEAYQAEAKPEEKKDLRELFEVARVFNQQEGIHLVSTCFFRRPGSGQTGSYSSNDEWPTQNEDDYFDFFQLMQGVELIRSTKPGVVFRLYLAGDLEMLVEPLVQAGCEVCLMAGQSSPWEAASMWRFLALEEEGRWLTFTQPSFGPEMIHDVERTEQVMRTELGFWRSPCFVGPKSQRSDARSYRPVHSDHFGSKGAIPAGELMRALIWHTSHGTMETRCLEMEGQLGYSLEGSKWPSNGFAEWFLLVAIFPRVAFEGVLTLLIWQRKTLSHWYALDIEYVTWANPASEVLVAQKSVPTEQAWSDMPESNGITLRPDTEVYRRERARIYEGMRSFPPIDEVLGFTPFEGNLTSLLAWTDHCKGTWWVDLNPALKTIPTGAELFMDRRYGSADVVVCGYLFFKITPEIAKWATKRDLDPELWKEGWIGKAPKLEGPVTLWRAAFSREFYRLLGSEEDDVKPEILLLALMQEGKAAIADTKAEAMGWKLR